MSLIKVSQLGEEFLLNREDIKKIKKGKDKFEFLILLRGDSQFESYEIFGDSGQRCEKLIAVKRLTDTKEK